MRALLVTLDRGVEITLRWFAILALALLLVLLTLGVIARAVPVFSMSGYDEVVEFLMAWMTFLVAVLLWRNGTLFRADALPSFLPVAVNRVLRVVILVAMLAFAVIYTAYGYKFAANATEAMAFFTSSKKPWYFALPVSGVLMIAYSVAALCRRNAPASSLGAVEATVPDAIRHP